MHVLNFLEDYFRENTSKWLGGQLLGTLLISFMEHRVFLFVLKTYICGNIWTELLEQSNVLGLELSVPIPSPPRGLWPNFRVWGLQNPRPICISKKHEWLQSCQFHSYNYANDNLIIRGLYKNELIGFQYIQVNEFIFFIFNEKRKFLKTSQYFSVFSSPLLTPTHSSSFENMFSSFLMKLAIDRQIVRRVSTSLLYTTSRLQNGLYYTQSRTKHKNTFVSRVTPIEHSGKGKKGKNN